MLIGIGNSEITSEMTNTDLRNNVNSLPILIVDSLGFSLSIELSGRPVGVLDIQSSNDSSKTQVEVSETSWCEVKGSSQNVGLAGTYSWNYPTAFYKWIRVNYTPVSGSGKIEHLYITSKR